MNILTSIKNLFCQRDINAAPASAPADKASPPPDSTELSCFVKGVIRSMEIEPEKWGQGVFGGSFGGPFSDSLHPMIYWKHQESSIQWGNWKNKLSMNSSDLTLTHGESSAIASAVKLHLETYRQKKAEEDCARNAIRLAEENAETKALFEKLGCPDKTP